MLVRGVIDTRYVHVKDDNRILQGRVTTPLSASIRVIVDDELPRGCLVGAWGQWLPFLTAHHLTPTALLLFGSQTLAVAEGIYSCHPGHGGTMSFAFTTSIISC